MNLSFLRIIASYLLLLLLACKEDRKVAHTQHTNADTMANVVLPSVQLETLLKPTNEFVISSIPVTAMKTEEIISDMDVVGTIEYDTKMIGNISARIDGRIDKLYVRYKYQFVKKGQRILDIYSPEMLTAQENLMFILKNDSANSSLIQAAKQKLLLLGMSSEQVQQTLQSGKPILSVSVNSNYAGHLQNSGESFTAMTPQGPLPSMGGINPSTELLNLKEGMYIQKGQTLFSIYNPSRAWALFSIYSDGQSSIQKGQLVKITPESAPSMAFEARIDFIEPFYREGRQTTSARVYFDNSAMRLPVGSQVRGLIFTNSTTGNWLPKEAVTSLGIDRIVFLKVADGFEPKKVITGAINDESIQILSGLSATDSVAIQAQFLMDSESFIKVKE